MKAGFKHAWSALLSWPKPPGAKQHAACHYCDTLHEAPQLKEGMSARCQRCGAVIYQNRPASLVRATAFSMTSLVLLVLVHAFPVLHMQVAGQGRDLTLFNTSGELFRNEAPILGTCVVLFTIIVPLFLITGMLYACLPLLLGRCLPYTRVVVKWMYRSEPWNMIEVFMLGVLVSLLKLAKVSDISFGLGFWALAGVMVCMPAAVAGIDKYELWDRLEVARR